jgi:hypothetical protein
MYASVRRYTGVDPRLFDELERHRRSLEATLGAVPGFRRTRASIRNRRWMSVRLGSTSSLRFTNSAATRRPRLR